jgi:hypothetical protein
MSTFTPCFAEGTRIATPDGLVPVEALQQGDLVKTAMGRGPRSIVWLGHRRIAPPSLPNAAMANPIRIAAGAFGHGLPVRDLRVSPEHAIFIDSVLIQARHLVNGSSIVQEQVDEVDYYHIELESHDVVYAEDLPAESWLDTGSRAFFDNASVVDLRPGFDATPKTEACAPIIEEGAILDVVRQRLGQRAGELGFAPDQRLIVALGEGRIASIVPADTRTICLVAPRAVRSGADQRRLGAAVASLCIDGANIALDDPCLTLGWHEFETDGTGAWRWTDNEALLQIEPQPYPRTFEIEVIATAAQQAA